MEKKDNSPANPPKNLSVATEDDLHTNPSNPPKIVGAGRSPRFQNPIRKHIPVSIPEFRTINGTACFKNSVANRLENNISQLGGRKGLECFQKTISSAFPITITKISKNANEITSPKRPQNSVTLSIANANTKLPEPQKDLDMVKCFRNPGPDGIQMADIATDMDGAESFQNSISNTLPVIADVGTEIGNPEFQNSSDNLHPLSDIEADMDDPDCLNNMTDTLPTALCEIGNLGSPEGFQNTVSDNMGSVMPEVVIHTSAQSQESVIVRTPVLNGKPVAYWEEREKIDKTRNRSPDQFQKVCDVHNETDTLRYVKCDDPNFPSVGSIYSAVLQQMAVFKLDQSLSETLGRRPKDLFEAGADFSLSFFDGAEDGHGAFGSNPSSVGSTSVASPSPDLSDIATASSTFTSVIPQPSGSVSEPKQEHQHYIVADSNNAANNNNNTVKTFVPCKVCGDKASGYHYGVTSCEGCKGFFRRSIQKQIEYRCLRDGKCLVIRLNRNRCQYCRFKKCLAVGMSRDSVRYGRVPKRSREHMDSENGRISTSDSSEQSDIESKNLAIYDVILMISQAHHANCDYTEDLTRGLIRKPISAPPLVCSNPEVATSTVENEEIRRVWLWQQFAVYVSPTIQRVVEFAKRVPGFCELGQDDQLILIKIGFFELWLVQVTRLISDTTLTFFDGTYLTKQQVMSIYNEEFAENIFEFAATFNAMALNDTELGLFCAVALLTPDRSALTDIKTIQQNQDVLLEALKIQVGRNHASEPHVLSTVVLKLAELRTIGAKHFMFLAWFRENWDKLRLPPLFAEIFDIPKCQEDLDTCT